MTSNRAVVFGVPRSGTTFVMDVLDAQPEAECVTGNLFPIALAHRAAQGVNDEEKGLLERAFKGTLTDYMDSGMYRSRSAALRKWWVTSRSPVTFRSSARGARSENLMIYKEPFLSFAPELGFDALDDSRVIYILRDGRDVAASLVRSYDVLTDEKLSTLDSNEAPIGRWNGKIFIPWWVGSGEEDQFAAADPYVRAIWMWREMTIRCEAFLKRPGVRDSGRVHLVRYEALMSEPLEVGGQMISHLGMKPNKRANLRLSEAHVRSIGAHKRLDAKAIRQAEEIAGPQLSALGYAVQG